MSVVGSCEYAASYLQDTESTYASGQIVKSESQGTRYSKYQGFILWGGGRCYMGGCAQIQYIYDFMYVCVLHTNHFQCPAIL